MSGVYLANGFQAEAVKMGIPELASVKAVGMGVGAGAPGTFAAAKEALAVQRAKGGDKKAEASALNALASACIAEGEPKNAVRAATEALAIFKELGKKADEIPVLQTLIAANLAKKDTDEAIRLALEVAETAKGVKDKKAEATAMGIAAKAYLAGNEARKALKTGKDALELLRGAGDKPGQASVWCAVSEANFISGKHAAALKAAKEAAALAKGDKKIEAAVMLAVADANPASADSLEAAKGAAKAFQDQGDKLGVGLAKMSAATAHMSQESPQFDDALQAAKDAVAAFKEAGCKGGEALAVCTLSFAHMAKNESQEAENTSREALGIFRDLKDSAGERYAMTILSSTKAMGGAQSNTRVLFDDCRVAHIEMNELATQEACEAVIDALLQAPDTQCVVVHLEGLQNSSGLQSYAVTSGSFILGLRTVGLPVICAMWGKIAGPAWGIVLASDYRIAATQTTFMLPLWGPPETFGDLVGHNVATDLTMKNGPASALSMLECGIIHECQKGKDSTRKCASEIAKRLAKSQSIATRQTMFLMSPAVERYALAAARGGIAF